VAEKKKKIPSIDQRKKRVGIKTATGGGGSGRGRLSRVCKDIVQNEKTRD